MRGQPIPIGSESGKSISPETTYRSRPRSQNAEHDVHRSGVDVTTATSLWFIRTKLSIRTPVADRDTSITMPKVPSQLKTFDIAETDDVVRAYLQTECLDHPTRGPYIKSRVLYEGVEDEIDNRFSLELFGLFCESRPYLEKWSRGYNGSYRYRILREHLR